jgi:hypothetical protein
MKTVVGQWTIGHTLYWAWFFSETSRKRPNNIQFLDKNPVQDLALGQSFCQSPCIETLER